MISAIAVYRYDFLVSRKVRSFVGAVRSPTVIESSPRCAGCQAYLECRLDGGRAFSTRRRHQLFTVVVVSLLLSSSRQDHDHCDARRTVLIHRQVHLPVPCYDFYPVQTVAIKPVHQSQGTSPAIDSLDFSKRFSPG